MNKKINACVIATLAFAVMSCSSGETQTKDKKSDKSSSKPAANCAAACEIPDDGTWITMFDGKTLNGWRGYLKKSAPDGWVVADGVITFSAANATAMEGADLIYDRMFKNFCFEIEWKLGKAGNSGIFYTAQEIEGMPIYYSSPEYQLLDNENMPDAWEGVGGNRQAGAVYDMIPPVPSPANPYDTWNSTRIVLRHGWVVHYLNGEKILEFQLGSPVWKALVDKSKFSPHSKDAEAVPEAYETMLRAGEKPGYIGLQDHGYGLAFRNIRIMELD